MIRFRVRTRSSAEMQKMFQRDRIPGVRILQSLFIIVIGIAFIASNANSSPYKEITGHMLDGYDHLTNGVYDATYLRISTDASEFFIFDKNMLRPAWTYPLKNERMDVYYGDGTPKHVVALQMYDIFGSRATKYTTGDYTSSQSASPVSNVGLDIGVILVVLGVLGTGNTIFKLVKARRLQSFQGAGR